MSWFTLPSTIPTAIFTILASYALWESHAPYKKRQRLRQTVAFSFSFSFFLSRSDHKAIITQLPGNMSTWRLPGDSYATEHQIWINLDKVFRDAGFTLWPNAFCFLLRIADYPSSSGFAYVIPTRGKKGVGALEMLREFDCRVCSFISVSILFYTLGLHL